MPWDFAGGKFMNLRTLLTLTVATLAFTSCDNDASQTVNPPAPTTDELIIADCYVVRDAMEAFAAENNGLYPQGLNDQSDTGHAFLSFLPNDARIVNRFTDLATLPVYIGYPQWPGEIGIMLFPEWSNPVGYRVVGRGRDGELIRLEKLIGVDPDLIAKHDAVMANVSATAAAADEFKRRSGHFPSDVGAEQLPTGETMTDFLPGGTMLTNPSSGDPSDPCDGLPSYPSGVGYSPIDRDGDGEVDSYLVEAMSEDGFTMVLTRTSHSDEELEVSGAALALRWAVEEYANANAGEYPSDVDLVREAADDFSNPYNGASPFHNGLATLRGEVGYLPIMDSGNVVGYIINARGLFDEIERLEVNAE